MEDNKDINENVEPTFLDGLKKSGDFETPPKYFDSFQKEVHEKIHGESASRPFYALPQFRVGIAAFGVAVIGMFVLNNTPTAESDLAFDSFSNEEVYSYLEENIDELSEVDIEDELDVEEIESAEAEGGSEADTPQIESVQKDTTKPKQEQEPEKPAATFDDLSEEEIMEFLMEEGYEDGEWDEL